ncbi:MAG: hypothetical protein LBG57_08225 [Treponema sp.]|nr:hypothetical protein [Treponema sp.]
MRKGPKLFRYYRKTEVAMHYEECREILLRECELVQQAGALQELIRDAAANREWTDFEGHFNALNTIEGEIAVLEKKREALFAEFDTAGPSGQTKNAPVSEDADGAAAKGRFYVFAARLPFAERNELSAIYRSLKLASLRLRMANDALTRYLGEARGILEGFFGLAFPDRGGRIYTMRGTPISQDMRSMVLNRRM